MRRFKLQSSHSSLANEGQLINGSETIFVEVVRRCPCRENRITPFSWETVANESRKPEINAIISLAIERKPTFAVVDGCC